MLARLCLFAIAAAISLCAAAEAKDVFVNGYTRKDGTYVAPYHRTAPDSNPYNNYSAEGNVNPYTGREGSRQPSYDVAPSYNPYAAPRREPEPVAPFGGFGGYGGNDSSSNPGSSFDNPSPSLYGRPSKNR